MLATLFLCLFLFEFVERGEFLLKSQIKSPYILVETTKHLTFTLGFRLSHPKNETSDGA